MGRDAGLATACQGCCRCSPTHHPPPTTTHTRAFQPQHPGSLKGGMQHLPPRWRPPHTERVAADGVALDEARRLHVGGSRLHFPQCD